MPYEIIPGDCRDALAMMGDNTVDSIVTDPPYHLTSIAKRFGPGQAPAQFGTDGAFARASRGFMGHTWDGGDIAFDPELWAECLRVLKPGGHLLAFSGTRTWHRMAFAIEAAGFDIRDVVSWIYGSGFPKSHSVSKAFDRMAGVERTEKVGEPPWNSRKPNGSVGVASVGFAGGGRAGAPDILAPVTPEAQQWSGWGTALKPACEPICVAQKPFRGSIAANVAAHGVGALNIDGCRVATDGGGRWPANVCHDGSGEVLDAFPNTRSGGGPAPGTERIRGAVYGEPNVSSSPAYGANDGSAARFFYCAKASKADREVGLPVNPDGSRSNTHPTVKPTDLMRWLVRLVTPPGGTVFDPFTGSGSTGRAAILEGCRFIGAELTPEYVPIAHARIDAAVNGR